MARCASRFIAFFCLLSTTVSADDRLYFPTEDERRWNTPPKLTPEAVGGKSSLDDEAPQPRFLPFSASFSLSAGGDANNAHSLSVGGSQDGVSFSQSASQGGSFGNQGSGISASQSSSFSAGLSGISAADANSFSLNHPVFGDNSQANGNSFALGQATSSAQGNVVNGQATSGAQSGVGASHSSATSGSAVLGSNQGQVHRQGRPTWTNIAPNYEVGGVYNPNGGRPKLHVSHGHRGPTRRPLRLDVSVDDDWQRRRPEVSISEYRPNGGSRGHRQGGTTHGFGHLQSSSSSSSASQQNWGSVDSSGDRQSWTQSPLTGPQPGSWSQSGDSEKPGLQISGASASSSATSGSPGSSSFGQSSSHSNLGPSGPTSWTNNNVQTSGNAQSSAQGSAAAVGQNFHGNTQGSFSSGAIAGGSRGNGFSQGNSGSGNRAGDSRGQVTSHATGNGFVQGTANSGSVSFVKFPGGENPQNIPRQFVRSRPASSARNSRRGSSKSDDPVGEIITDLTDTVVDLFDI